MGICTNWLTKLKLKMDVVQMTSAGAFWERIREENQEGPQRQHLSCFLGAAIPRHPGLQEVRLHCLYVITVSSPSS